jgi:hypothetical protein
VLLSASIAIGARRHRRLVQIRFLIQAEALVVWIGFPRKNQSEYRRLPP